MTELSDTVKGFDIINKAEIDVKKKKKQKKKKVTRATGQRILAFKIRILLWMFQGNSHRFYRNLLSPEELKWVSMFSIILAAHPCLGCTLPVLSLSL